MRTLLPALIVLQFSCASSAPTLISCPPTAAAADTMHSQLCSPGFADESQKGPCRYAKGIECWCAAVRSIGSEEEEPRWRCQRPLPSDESWAAESPTLPPPLKITFVDVDEGDAILIQVGEFDALIDTGNRGKWDGQLGRVLKSVSGPLELLVLTHPQADHYGQTDEVMGALEVERIITNGESRGPPRDDKQKIFFQKYLDALAAEGVTPQVSAVGALPSPIAGLELEVLATGRHEVDTSNGSDINNDSLVLMLTYAGQKALFAADIEDVVGARLVAENCEKDSCPKLKADVLKVPHHGSKHFDQGFFEAVKPRFAVISAGFHNEQLCLPRRESYQALKLLGAKVFSTSAEGTGDVSVVISPDGNMDWSFPDNPVFVWETQEGRKCVGPLVFEQG